MSIIRYNWTHENWCRPSDPINIIFENISLDEIGNFLKKRGWRSKFTLGFDHVVPYPNIFQKIKQTRQFIGPGLFCILKRCHIRLWKIEGKILGAVHYDRLRSAHHEVTDFESVEQYFSDECSTNKSWEVLVDEIDLKNSFSSYKQPYNNGKATLIRRKK